MKFSVQVIVHPDDDCGGPAVVREVFALDRDALTPDTLGLRLGEAQDLLVAVQDTIVAHQVQSAVAAQTACPECGRPRRHKDTRTIVVRSLFGALRLPSPRWWHCHCHEQPSRTFQPLAELLPDRTTPELAYLQYGLAMTHYLAGVRDLVFVLAPLLYVLTGISGVRGATAGEFFEHFVPYYLLAIVAFWHAASATTSWRSIVIGFASAPALVKATWMTIAGRFGQFTLTPKSRSATAWWRTGGIYAAGLVACLVTVLIALTSRRGPAVILAGAWTAYLAVMFAASLVLVVADARHGRLASTPGRAAIEPMILRGETSGRLRPQPPLQHRIGRLVGAAAAAAALVVVTTIVTIVPPGPPSRAAGASPLGIPAHLRVGISGADPEHTARVARNLGVGDPTLGRTFEVADSLDRGWADRATADGAVPWITLVFSHNGQRALDSALTAISNGVHDDELNRWAREIAALARPVYLTVLPQADRDFAASSAVAHGGIPHDVYTAWQHIRGIFAAARTTNVAWVWGPADPASDHPYTPPADQIDAVALTWYEYPGTAWINPASTVAAVAARHPGKPLLVEVSAPPSQVCRDDTLAPPGAPRCPVAPSPYVDRDTWLSAVTAALATRRDVAAIVYHDGGPYTDAADRRSPIWRLSDPPAWAAAVIAGADRR